MGLFKRTGNDLGYLTTGVDSKTLGEPAFADFVACAHVLSKLTPDVNGTINNAPNIVSNQDRNFQNFTVKLFFTDNGVDVPNPDQPGSVGKAILALEEKLADAVQRGDNAAAKDICEDLTSATMISIAALIEMYPYLFEPFKTYCRNTWG